MGFPASVAVDDCGCIINPLIVEGQVHGGVVQGIAQILHEAFLYDEDGNPLTANLAMYGFPSAADVPSITHGPHGDAVTEQPAGSQGRG